MPRRVRHGDRTVTAAGPADDLKLPAVERMKGVVDRDFRTQGIVAEGSTTRTPT